MNVLIPRLSAVTVTVVTGTEGPAQTHIPVDSESGLTSYDVSYVNATDLHSVDKARLRHRRGRLHPRETGEAGRSHPRLSGALIHLQRRPAPAEAGSGLWRDGEVT